jgi:hypothetical protein
MPLQIRRGPTVDRQSIVPLAGELVYDTDLGAVYIGDGTTPGGVAVTNYTNLEAITAVGDAIQASNPLHTGISFQRVGSDIIATVSEQLSGAFKGSIFSNDSSLVIDGESGNIFGNFIGSVFAEDSTGPLVDGITGSVNLNGTVKGDIVPNADSIYDLGSPTNRFRDLYLSGASLDLGGARIFSPDGLSVQLPSGTTIDGEQILLAGAGEARIDTIGSVFGDDSTILVNGTESSINLDGTVKGNVIPGTAETFDLGSFATKFRNLYLTESASALFIGNAVIGSSGTAISLPAGSTVGGVPIGSGSGSGDGVIEGSTYKINIAADDSTIMLNTDTQTLNGNISRSTDLTISTGGQLSLSSTGLSSISSGGSLSIDGTSIAIGSDVSATGINIGNGSNTFTINADTIANGVITGTSFQGDLRGSVYADDSTVIIDATSSTIAGTFTGTINSGSNGILRTDASNERILSLQQFHDDSVQSSLTLSRARGSSTAPTTLITEDGIANLDFNGFNGTSTYVSARIKGVAEGTITGSAVPGRIEFITADSDGTLRRRLYIDSNGFIVAEGGQSQILTNYAGGLAATIMYQNYDDANIRNFIFAKSRGDFITPTSVAPLDILGQISFHGYESTSANYIQSAAIRATAQTISTGAVASSISFLTNNGTSIASRVAITAAGRLDAFNGLRVTGTIQPGVTNGNVILDPAIQGTGEVRTTGPLRVNSRVLINDNRISTLTTNDDIELDPNGTGTVDFQVLEQTSVGAAGAADALPATPSTYFKIKVNGVEYVVPAYAVS